MATDPLPQSCRLCHAPLLTGESSRRLCSVCDEYAQHVALQTNRQLDRVVGDLQNGALFVAASRNAH
jgi:hypothetical protein